MELNILQIIAAVIGSMGFTMVFHLGRRRLITAAFGGFLSRISYLILFYFTSSVFTSTFCAAIFVCIYAEIMARIKKAPANIFLIPSIIPLLPGSDLYYTMTAVLSHNMIPFQEKGLETLAAILGITVGIVIGSFLFQELFNVSKKIREDAI